MLHDSEGYTHTKSSTWLGIHPPNTIYIEFQIQLKYICVHFLAYQPDENKLLLTQRQMCCLGVCKISLWS